MRKKVSMRTFSLVLSIFLWGCLGFALVPNCVAADKHERAIGLYDVTVHFQDPAIDWMQISDAFVKQCLIDNGANGCIKLVYLPMRFLGNTTPQTLASSEETPGLDYAISGDLYKDDKGYRMEACMVTGKSRKMVLKTVRPSFTDPKEAPWKAMMAALELRSNNKGSRLLADCIFDYEKTQREANPRDHAIAPEFKLDGEDTVTRLKRGESHKFSISLIDCDGVSLSGAEVQVEVHKGSVKPATVRMDGSGKGEFTYTAPNENCEVQVRAEFPYVRGSEHMGVPVEVKFSEVQVGKVAGWNGTIKYKLAGSITGQAKKRGFTYPSQLDESATFTGTFKPEAIDVEGDAYRIVSGTGSATINDTIDEVNQGTSQRTRNTGKDSVSIPEGAFRLLFSKDGRSYSIEYTKVMFTMQYTIYEPNDPKQVWQEASPLNWFVPPLTLKDIPMPSEGIKLKGSRKIKVPVNLVGMVAEVEAEISWGFEPMKETTPAKH